MSVLSGNSLYLYFWHDFLRAGIALEDFVQVTIQGIYNFLVMRVGPC